ncbi:hypothetical protein MTP99_004779 [Tenebrio molitor]|nr:hypothetical protein MTP99_004779 [Tenebrio molitor]CAH1380858.1 unnamed protein product [Tenebrio molitor]
MGRRKVEKVVTPRIRNFRLSWSFKGTLSSTKRITQQLFARAQETSYKFRKSVRYSRKRYYEVHPVTVLLRKRKSGIENENVSPTRCIRSRIFDL